VRTPWLHLLERTSEMCLTSTGGRRDERDEIKIARRVVIETAVPSRIWPLYTPAPPATPAPRSSPSTRGCLREVKSPIDAASPCPPLLEIWRQQARDTLTEAFADAFSGAPSGIAVSFQTSRGQTGPVLVPASAHHSLLPGSRRMPGPRRSSTGNAARRPGPSRLGTLG